MNNPYQQYAQNQITTASPEELTLLLYKGTVKFISLAIKALEEKKYSEVNNNIIRAQEIYYELLATLDQKYSIAKNLASLYDYILRLLISGNIKKDKELLQDALGMSKEFVETWEQAITIYRKAQVTNDEWVK